LSERQLEPDNAQRRAAVARVRRARERRRDRLRVIPFEVRDDEIEGLVQIGLLNPEDRNNRAAVALAVGTFLDHFLPEHWPRLLRWRDDANRPGPPPREAGDGPLRRVI
jgi:hypothetical protein